MYVALRAFVKAESSGRIKRSLRHPVRASEEFFENGKKVYYKRDEKNDGMVQVKLLAS